MDDKAKLEALRRAADIGWAAIERGEVRSFTSAKALSRYLRRAAAKAINKQPATRPAPLIEK